MDIRPFTPEDVAALVGLSAECARGENDFVLNPLWESEAELAAEFERFGIDPREHVLVAESGGEVLGMAGLLRRPRATLAGMFCPVVKRGERGRGVGGQLLRGVIALAGELGVKLVTAGIGTRNRGGYSLLTSHGFRPSSQHFLMRCDAPPDVAAPPIADLERRAAGPDDADAILGIYEKCGFEARDVDTMHAHLTGPRHTHAVSVHDGRVVAFAEIETHWPRRPWVAYVGVTPELRDRGVGSNLVAWAVARQFEGEAVAAQLLLSPANRTALRAYEKVGFRRSRLIDVLEQSL